jgi:hypothetical protein
VPLSFPIAADHGPVAIAATWAVVYPLVNVPALATGLRTISLSVRRSLTANAPAAPVASMVAAVAVLPRISVGHADAARFAIVVGAVP